MVDVKQREKKNTENSPAGGSDTWQEPEAATYNHMRCTVSHTYPQISSPPAQGHLPPTPLPTLCPPCLTTARMFRVCSVVASKSDIPHMPVQLTYNIVTKDFGANLVQVMMSSAGT